MFHIVLVHPEIPPNTGNVIRLAANTGCALHLVKPLGFPLDDAKMRRAGLDYREFADLRVHDSWEALRAECAPDPERVFAMTSHGAPLFAGARFLPGDWFVFGCESRGLGEAFLSAVPERQRLRLPMMPGNRSLNLSNAVAVTVFEAWRQNGFAGAV